MLTDQKIRAEAGHSTAYHNGCRYYSNGKVTDFIEKEDGRYEATVLGNEDYHTWVQLDSADSIKKYHCTCPAFENYEGACKHIVALLKAAQRKLDVDPVVQKGFHKLMKLTDENPDNTVLNDAVDYATKSLQVLMRREQPTPVRRPSEKPKRGALHPAISELLNHFDAESPDLELAETGETRLQPILNLDPYSFHFDLNLEFSIGQKKLYVVKDLLALAEAMLTGVPLSFGAGFTLYPGHADFDTQSRALMELLLQVYRDEKQLTRQYYGVGLPSFVQKRGLKLSPTRLNTLLDILGEGPVGIRLSGQPVIDAPIIHGKPQMKASIRKGSGVIEVTLQSVYDELLQPLLPGGRDYYCAGAIYRADESFKLTFDPFLTCMEKCREPVIEVPDGECGRVMETLLPALRAISEVEIDPKLEAVYDRIPLRTSIWLDRYLDGISARIEHIYGARRFCGVTGSELSSGIQEDRILLRQSRDERGILKAFMKAGFRVKKELLLQDDEEGLFTFVSRLLPGLKEIAEIYCSDEFNTLNVRRPVQLTAGIRLTENNMLELNFECPGMTLKDLAEVLMAYGRKKRYHRLRDGSFLSLEGDEVQGAATLMENLNLTEAELQKQRIELPKFRALYLDSLLRESKGVRAERSGAFKKLVQDIVEPDDLEYPIPEGILGTLRDYQKTGFRWLKSLAHYGLGGILADDMGLGKTLQVIVFILSEKTADSPPNLVVAPTSLIYNWQEEVRKFAPQLRTLVVAGSPNERKAQLENCADADLVITSYGLLKRDIDYYKTHQFQYCIIDEAQHIKNPATLGAKTVKDIQAKCCFALTGTPIENALTELWSLFDFLMPGYLLTHAKFRTRYESPIAKSQDPKALRDLSRHIRPFILRRMKQDVLKELPDKIESSMVSRMTPEQTKLYAAHLAQAKKEFKQVLDDGGFERSQIRILALLTRLRQLCCHPGLFLEGYRGGSGKLEMLMELIEDATNSGHRILLFSQFTGMLALIQAELVQAKVSFFYLDGSTKSEERMRMVNAFNGGEKQVFLISLKAGGTGLNLTGADMVIHYDPWWNPAVEDQATDRAYRIGQNKSVQVVRMLTQGTIEERIYTLQQKKKALVDSVLEPGENFLSRMSESDIRGLFD